MFSRSYRRSSKRINNNLCQITISMKAYGQALDHEVITLSPNYLKTLGSGQKCSVMMCKAIGAMVKNRTWIELETIIHKWNVKFGADQCAHHQREIDKTMSCQQTRANEKSIAPGNQVKLGRPTIFLPYMLNRTQPRGLPVNQPEHQPL